MKNTVFLLPLLALMGCSHSIIIHESSQTATTDEITTHLKSQLNCTSLTLKPDSTDHYTGSGTNESGGFTITVTRKGETIEFEGKSTEVGRGAFHGSASWNHTIETHSRLKSSNTSENNTSSYSLSPH